MEPLNLKVLPFAFLSIFFAFLSFNTATDLISNVEILLDLSAVLGFLIKLSIYIALTTICIALVLSQTKHIYYRLGLFFLIFLPYASVFLLKFQINTLLLIAILVLFAGMCLTVLIEFDHFYANQIRTRIETPARANARSITFFIALITAMIFLVVNNNPQSKAEISTRILDETTSAISTTIEDYGLIEKLSGQMVNPQITESEVGKKAIEQAKPQINKYISDQINAMITPYMPYIIYILTFLVFGTIAGASTLSSLITLVLGFILSYTLKSTGYARVTTQTVEVTRLTL